MYKSIEEVEITEITKAENKDRNKCSSRNVYIVLFSIIFTISIGIAIYFVYFYQYLKIDIPRVEFNTCTQATIH